MSQKFCTNCGTAFVEGAAFCVSCGTPAQAAGAAQPAAAQPAPPPAMAAPAAPAYAPAPAYPAQPAATPPYAGQDGVQPPPAYPAGYPGAVPTAKGLSGWTWQRWALLAVGALLLLGGLRQMGVLGGADSAVVGRWASDSRCLLATVLNANGTFTAPNGSTGRWTLNNNLLTLSGANGSTTLRLISSTRNTLVVQGEGGAPETLVRC